jgi:hypothetical protein
MCLFIFNKVENSPRAGPPRVESTSSLIASLGIERGRIVRLEVTIARKVLPHPQGIKGKGACAIWGCLYDPNLPGRDMRRDDFDILK